MQEKICYWLPDAQPGDGSQGDETELVIDPRCWVGSDKNRCERLQQENAGVAIPADMVTTSGSGLDPDVSPASVEFQIPRVAKARGISPEALRLLAAKYLQARQYGIFGEARVNVLELNLELDKEYPTSR